MRAVILSWDDLVTPPDDQLATPFELWCETHGVHPDHPGAWEAFAAARIRVGSHA